MLSPTGGCATLKVLSDLWELSLSSALAGGTAFAAVNLDPPMSGLAGCAAVIIPGEEFRLLVFGGTGKPYPLYGMVGASVQASPEIIFKGRDSE